MSDCKTLYMKVTNDPFLDAAMRGWIFNTARANFWRVSSWYEFDDLVADGYLCYYKCRSRYDFLTVKKHPLPEDKRRFMGLVQAAFTNHITDLANRRTVTPELALSSCFEDDYSTDQLTELLPPQQEEATLRVLLASAPKELVDLVKLLAQEGRETVKYVRSRLHRQDNGQLRKGRPLRETTNEYYCRRLGLNSQTTDLISLVRAYLGLEDAFESTP